MLDVDPGAHAAPKPVTVPEPALSLNEKYPCTLDGTGVRPKPGQLIASITSDGESASPISISSSTDPAQPCPTTSGCA